MTTLDQTTPADVTEPQPLAGRTLGHRFADELPELCEPWQADPAPAPELVVLNEELTAQLGLDVDALRTPSGVELLMGDAARLEAETAAEPVALGYAGHQFGNYSPRLGDGRALLLGELTDPNGEMVDVHLKGSGRTPFARGGDGKATVGPMLREYLVAESLHALGVPTTRSLAVVTTGETIGRNGPEPGAVLTRIAASHIRVGTFQYAAHLGGQDLVRRLADHTIARHHPDAAAADNPYRALLDAVIDVQAELIARWMLVGFIHGVMNTDNMTVSGEGIDYGPCAFMDRYDPATVFSSIDHGGRYAFANQPRIATWNLARFAETLLGLLAEDSDEAIEVATELLNSFSERFDRYWRAGMAAKLGLGDPAASDTSLIDGLIDDLVDVLHTDGLDWTSTFRGLAGTLRKADPDETTTRGDGAQSALERWKQRWHDQLQVQGRPRHQVADAMDRVNPNYIPRNHLIEEALEAATSGDPEPFHRLAELLADPFSDQPGAERYTQPASATFTESFRTFCGT